MTANSNDDTYPRVGIFEGEGKMNAATSTWYVKKRRNIEVRWKDSKPILEEVQTHTSPGGKYALKITPCIFDIHRNCVYIV